MAPWSVSSAQSDPDMGEAVEVTEGEADFALANVSKDSVFLMLREKNEQTLE